MSDRGLIEGQPSVRYMKQRSPATLTAVQALGVALTIPASTMTMGECQDAAPAMLEHLHNMGFDIVQRDLARALAESEERVRVLTKAAERVVTERGPDHKQCGCEPGTGFDCDIACLAAALAALSEWTP